MPAPKRGRLLPAELVGEVLDSSPVPLVTRPVAVVPGSWHYSAVALGVSGRIQRGGFGSVSGPPTRRMSHGVREWGQATGSGGTAS